MPDPPGPGSGCSRAGYVHEVDLDLEPGVDRRAPGGEVTRSLCGHWEHDGVCRWPHLTLVEGDGPTRLRVLVVADPTTIAEVRSRIEGALRTATGWTVRATRPPRPLTGAETEWAQRQLTAS